MRFQFEPVRSFFRDNRGAITVDYVVLAAACCAVGIWSTDLIKIGMRSLAGTVSSELRGDSAETDTATIYDNRFDNGSQGWTGATTRDLKGEVGIALGPIGNTRGLPGVSRDFSVAPDAARSTFGFDLYSIDDLDGDTGTIFVDNTAVGTVTVDNKSGVQTFRAADDLEERGIIVRFTEVDSGINLAGRSTTPDSSAKIEITVRNDQNDPRSNINIGFGSDATGAGQAFFAIDNFQATTTARAPSPGTAAADTPTG